MYIYYTTRIEKIFIMKWANCVSFNLTFKHTSTTNFNNQIFVLEILEAIKNQRNCEVSIGTRYLFNTRCKKFLSDKTKGLRQRHFSRRKHSNLNETWCNEIFSINNRWQLPEFWSSDSVPES